MPSARNYHDIKRGWWNGKWYDSSWELALLVFFHDNHLELTRNTRKFPYRRKGSKKIKYFQPDFILENGHYIEVKGIFDADAKAKIACFPYPIEIWGKKEIQPYIEYMEKTYGKDWREKF